VESPIRNEDLEEVLKRLGIESVAYYQVRFTGDGSNDDKDDLKWRGGFSAKEANKQVSHAPVSIKTTTNGLSKEFVRDQYHVKSGEFNNKSAMVFMDANGSIYLIHLINILSDEVVTACNLLTATLDTYNNNWAKAVAFQEDQIGVLLKNRAAILERQVLMM
jgi:hypothetical protein